MRHRTLWRLPAVLLLFGATSLIVAPRARGTPPATTGTPAGAPTLIFVGQPTGPGNYCTIAIDSNGRIYRRGPSQGENNQWFPVAQLPAGVPISVTEAKSAGQSTPLPAYVVGMANGDVWNMDNFTNSSTCYDTSWQQIQFTYLGNVFAGNVVPTAKATFGNLKATYR